MLSMRDTGSQQHHVDILYRASSTAAREPDGNDLQSAELLVLLAFECERQVTASNQQPMHPHATSDTKDMFCQCVNNKSCCLCVCVGIG